MGLIWAEPDGAQVLRRPAYDTDGLGLVLIAIGPLLLVPDLLINLPRALRSVGRLGREINELPGEVGRTRDALGRTRDELQAMYDGNAPRTQAWVGDLNALRARTAALTRDLGKAQAKLTAAEHELAGARYRDVPAWGGSAYALGKYQLSPPALTQEWLSRPAPSSGHAPDRHPSAADFLAKLREQPAASQKPTSPRDVWSLLVPDRPDRCLLATPQHLELRVAITRRPAATLRFQDWDRKPRSPVQFQNWDKRS